jgi:hypothetical protein
MGSTVRSIGNRNEADASTLTTIRWRSWPLVDYPRWSWVAPVGVLAVGCFVWQIGGDALLAVMVAVALCVALWQYFLPVTFEICSLGIRRYALRRMRLVPWQDIGSYQLRLTGIVFFRSPRPIALEILRSLFVPYPNDEDEMIVAVRHYLSHANELP